MKTNFLAKHKWYIVGFILIAVMLSVSLSFSAWDTLSFKAIMNAKGGDFKEKSAWSDYIKLATDGDRYPVGALNQQIDVGDIVTYGKFYQDKDAAVVNSATYGKTEPLRWIVVDDDGNNKLTLLTEKVVVYGTYRSDGYVNDYYRSTVRSWLNSGRSSVGSPGVNDNTLNDNVRNDNVGSTFSGTATNQVNKGFLDVAFTGGAEKLLVPKKIAGMRYVASGSGGSFVLGNCTTTPASGSRTSINDLVWTPSAVEMIHDWYGGLVQMDDSADKGFTYTRDKNNKKMIAGATDYAWNAISSSYHNNGGGSNSGTQKPVDSNNDGIMESNGTMWWLRSPYPNDNGGAIIMNFGGGCHFTHLGDVRLGVRPAVCVQL